MLTFVPFNKNSFLPVQISYDIRNRLRKGDSKVKVLQHIFERSFALLLMGVFMVNLENINGEALLYSSSLWQILMTLAFFLIWNVYGERVMGRFPPWILKGLGWTILLFLAITYTGAGDGGDQWMRFHWWGILGLIGWAYLLAALIYLGLGKHPLWLALAFILLLILNINEFRTPLPFSIKLVVSASNYALVMGGVVVSSVLIRLKEEDKMQQFIPYLLGFAALLLLFGFLTRPAWGISKILATPSWTAICAGVTALSFLLLYLLADKAGQFSWSKIIEPAGSMTLSCYLLPYFVYAFREILGFALPDALTTGGIGILKSLIFAILIIQLTGLLGKLNIKLKI